MIYVTCTTDIILHKCNLLIIKNTAGVVVHWMNGQADRWIDCLPVFVFACNHNFHPRSQNANSNKTTQRTNPHQQYSCTNKVTSAALQLEYCGRRCWLTHIYDSMTSSVQSGLFFCLLLLSQVNQQSLQNFFFWSQSKSL